MAGGVALSGVGRRWASEQLGHQRAAAECVERSSTVGHHPHAYQNFKPYPQFGAIQHYSNYGHNTHHGATLRVEKRYGRGTTLNSFWTFSKTMNDVDEDGGASGITFFNRRLEKAAQGTTSATVG